MSKEQDRVFFRNFTLILLALALFGVFAAYMGRYFAAMVPLGGVKTETVAERVAPVGEVYTEDNPPPASAGVTSTAATKEAAAEGQGAAAKDQPAVSEMRRVSGDPQRSQR